MLEEFVNEKAKAKGIAIMAHTVCGYPSFEANFEILEEFEKAGVDVVELQFPFSEPIADGPLFLTANQESLNSGTTVEDCFKFMEKASEKFSFKILMMGYYNTVYKFGEDKFCSRLKKSGGDGLIIPDLPLEEALSLLYACKEHGLDSIPLVAPTNTDERLKKLLEGARGFVYAVARKGVTGQKTEFSQEFDAYLTRLKKVTDIPLAVGFGVSSRDDILALKGKAEMAVIGSAVMKSYLDNGRKGVAEFFSSLT